MKEETGLIVEFGGVVRCIPTFTTDRTRRSESGFVGTRSAESSRRETTSIELGYFPFGRLPHSPFPPTPRSSRTSPAREVDRYADRRRSDPQFPPTANWHSSYIDDFSAGENRRRHRTFFDTWPHAAGRYEVETAMDVRALPHYKATRSLVVTQPAIRLQTPVTRCSSWHFRSCAMTVSSVSLAPTSRWIICHAFSIITAPALTTPQRLRTRMGPSSPIRRPRMGTECGPSSKRSSWDPHQ